MGTSTYIFVKFEHFSEAVRSLVCPEGGVEARRWLVRQVDDVEVGVHEEIEAEGIEMVAEDGFVPPVPREPIRRPDRKCRGGTLVRHRIEREREKEE